LFMRGAAATVEVSRHLEFTGFFSRKRIDANVSALSDPTDSLGINAPEVVFSSFQEDGFHRTFNELRKKDAITETLFGGHLRYRKPTWSIGATAAHAGFDVPLSRTTRPYNQFDFSGKENTTAGLDWNVLYRNLTWFGEVSTSA